MILLRSFRIVLMKNDINPFCWSTKLQFHCAPFFLSNHVCWLNWNIFVTQSLLFKHLLGRFCYEVPELQFHCAQFFSKITFVDSFEIFLFRNFFSGIYWDDFATKLRNYRGGSEKWPRPFLPIRQMPQWTRLKNISWRLNRWLKFG